MTDPQQIAVLQEIISIARKARPDANQSAAEALRIIEVTAARSVVEHFSCRILG